jgi:NADPH:quinone reductase-like Zn-dependent oxidoreductase
MQAIAIDAFGGPEQLHLMDLPMPEPRPDEVLMRVEAAGVGWWDVQMRQGDIDPDKQHFPLVLGWESVGTITALGEHASGWKVGDRVYVYEPQSGHYAEYVAARAGLVAAAPVTLDAAQAACLPVCGLTAHQAVVDQLHLKAGETLLITGASSVTGELALQIARRLGVTVIGTSTTRNHPHLYALGAAQLIDYAQLDFVAAVRAAYPQGVDAVLDCVGGETAARSMAVVRDGGRLASIVDVDQVKGQPDAQRLGELARMVDSGQLAVHLGSVFPLEEARQAQDLVSTHHAQGKVVLKVE